MLRTADKNVQNIGAVTNHSIAINGGQNIHTLSREELVAMLQRKDEQIDRLLHIIDNLSGTNNK